VSLGARPALGRVAALLILAALVVMFCVGPLAAYCSLIADNSDALASREALLQRYHALAAAVPGGAPKPSPVAAAAGPALLYPDMPESQISALLQETVKNAAASAHVQILGLQVLRGEAIGGATRVGVRVRASGDMASLRSLLYTVESTRPLLYPDNLSIQSHAIAADAAPGALDFQLDISGFQTGPPS
jgi:general secretion pathway protein M